MKAFITGVTGQDGAYLSRLLLGKGYEVYGGERRGSSRNRWRLKELGIESDIRFLPFELGEPCARLVEAIEPDEIYNLAAQSFVPVSFEQPVYTGDANGLGCLRILEAIRQVKPDTRFYQASTSEMFGNAAESPQSETTPFRPRSPYAAAKVYAHHVTVNYREAFGLHASCGICFNHESPLRGEEFVTRKICAGLAAIKRGDLGVLRLGNLDAMRDWGFAGDYVKAMWLMLQQEEPDDYVIATGTSTSVKSFLSVAAEVAGLDPKSVVKTSPTLYRPAEVDRLWGNASKAKHVLGWKFSTDPVSLAALMMEAELARAIR